MTAAATESPSRRFSATRKKVVRPSRATKDESLVVRTETTPLANGWARAAARRESSNCPGSPSVIRAGPCTVTAKNSLIGREKRVERNESATRASVVALAPPRSLSMPTVSPARTAARTPMTAQIAMTAQRQRTRARPRESNTAQW